MNQDKTTIKALVKGFYDQQQLRIQMGNRIVTNFKIKLGQDPGTAEEELDDKAKEILATLRASHKKITDGVKRFPDEESFISDGVISEYTELCLVDHYIRMEIAESAAAKYIEGALSAYPISKWLLEVPGCGPLMAGVIIAEIDIEKARHPSSLWKLAGLDVAHDGRGRSKRPEHLIDVEYNGKDGTIKTKKSITFKPLLKAKLMGVLATSFLRSTRHGENKYSQIYRGYKARLESHDLYGVANDKARKKAFNKKDQSCGPKWPNPAPVAQRHRMALRYAVKIFLTDLYVAWRTMEGLPVSVPYHEAKLGMKHGE